MLMWIKSQDGNRVVRVDSICYERYPYNGQILHYIVGYIKDGGESITLGKYSTEKQSRDIIYEICDGLVLGGTLYTMPENEEV